MSKYDRSRYRKDKSPLKRDDWNKTPAKKNTKKWCKGVVGREHTIELALITKDSRTYLCDERHIAFPFYVEERKPGEIRWACFHNQVCTACGKVISWFIRKENCPTYIERYGIQD